MCSYKKAKGEKPMARQTTEVTEPARDVDLCDDVSGESSCDDVIKENGLHSHMQGCWSVTQPYAFLTWFTHPYARLQVGYTSICKPKVGNRFICKSKVVYTAICKGIIGLHTSLCKT